MTHPIHDPTVKLIEQAIELMDKLLRYQIDQDEYKQRLRQLDVEELMVAHREEFKTDPRLVYYLDALMMLNSLQHEIDFQTAEYGFNVAQEDIKMLKEIMVKFTK